MSTAAAKAALPGSTHKRKNRAGIRATQEDGCGLFFPVADAAYSTCHLEINMKLKTFAAVAALALSATGSAFAEDIVRDAGSVGMNATVYELMNHDEIGLFTDTISFTIVAGDLSHSANPLNVMLSGVDISNISNLEYTLWSSDNQQLGTEFLGNNTTNWSLALPAGDYVFRVTGNADGSFGGTYGFAMSLVPEPETYAMLLAGLGLIGFATRRRSDNEKFSA